MKTINIAEILVDYPKGTKLYSPIFGDVYLDKIRPHLAVVVVILKEDEKSKEEFLYDGRYTINGECMLFPSKENRDWESYELFKKGDIVASKAGNIAMYSHCENNVVYYQCILSPLGTLHVKNDCGIDKIKDIHKASHSQTLSLLKALQDNGYYYNSYTKTITSKVQQEFINMRKFYIRYEYYSLGGPQYGNAIITLEVNEKANLETFNKKFTGYVKVLSWSLIEE